MKKVRDLTYQVVLREKSKIEWNSDTQTIEFRDENGNISEKHLISVSETYERDGKTPKVLRQMDYPFGGLSFNPESFIYDRYLAIDTNFVPVGNLFLCVTCYLTIEQKFNNNGRINKGDQLCIRLGPRLVFLAKKNTKPERYGWMKVIDSLLRYDGYRADWHYGVVVDSDLNDLPRINAKEISILNDFYTPENISLIYASADVGRDNFLNKMIREVDRIANITVEPLLAALNNKILVDMEEDFSDLLVVNDFVKVRL